ncbi:class I SAM-dependent methyltransferase [Phreatobacter sp.]|uniref:class I SAM-dependent methyltransferase n=1 Tax=Phreatobacter sp. TaxID=1966341 RepID=UPI003F6EED64
MSGNASFDQSRYWITRHEEYRGDPRSVGNLAASAEENAAGEEQFRALMSQVANRLVRPGGSVLDLGSGYGRVSGSFTDAGFHYVGLDVSPTAVHDGKERNPAAQFQVVDLLKWKATKRHDLVCALFVLVHFVDDQEWSRFLDNAMASVSAKGHLLIADYFPPAERQSSQHYVARPWAEYVSRLQLGGFVLDAELTQSVHAAAGDNRHAGYLRFARREA